MLTLIDQLHPLHWQTLSSTQRTRLVWRIGEYRLKNCTPRLVALLGQGDEMLDYCLAYAIGRSGDAGAALAMAQLMRQGGSDKVRRMGRHAWLALADEAARQHYAAQLVDDWPAAIRHVWAQQDVAVVQAVLADFHWHNLSFADWLEQLDSVALMQPWARSLLLALVRNTPLQAGTFRALRHLYKAAEFRDDGVLFGVLQQRFETTSALAANRKSVVKTARGPVRFIDEVRRPDSLVAYNERTRDYLRRRGWRTLRKLGERHDAAFIPMATGALLAMQDPPERDGYPYRHWMLFHRLLHPNYACSASGKTWVAPTHPSQQRQEAFPERWNQAPDAVLQLLLNSRCLGVHQFALRVMREQSAYCAQLDALTVQALLASPYADTAQFAFELCKTRFAAELEATIWLQTMLQSSYVEAQQFALTQLTQQLARYAACADLFVTLLTSATLCQQGVLLYRQLPSDTQQAVAAQVLTWLKHQPNLGETGQVLAALPTQYLPHAALCELLAHLEDAVVMLAGAWLLQHSEPVAHIPAPLLVALFKSNSIPRNVLAVQLLAALPDTLLAQQPELVAALCTHENDEIRGKMQLILQRLAVNYPLDTVHHHLLNSLFCSQPDAVQQDVLSWLTGLLNRYSISLAPAHIARLLLARSRAAQKLGAALLPHYNAACFSIKEIASFARNENLSVRLWVQQVYQQDTERIAADLASALLLFNSPWDDSRQFARTYFQQQAHWTPEQLLVLCDHNYADVQQFGRELLEQQLANSDLHSTLIKLGEHPSSTMQHWLSDKLISCADGKLEVLQQLQPYFLSVLSQVQRNRPSKNRVLQFLRQQSLHSAPIAEFVAHIFSRQVLTVTLADKAQYIEGLREIQRRYPDIATGLSVKAVEVRA